MPCAEHRTINNEPVPDFVKEKYPQPLLNHQSPPESVIISIGYLPGSGSDFTHWTTQISDRGEVRQAICRQETGKSYNQHEEMKIAQLSPPGLKNLNELILKFCERRENLDPPICMDGASEITVNIPTVSIVYSYPLDLIDSMIRKKTDELDEEFLEAHRSFRALWKAVDANSPYTTSEHGS